MLVLNVLETQKAVVDGASWPEFNEVHYLKCTDDQALPPPVQDIIVNGFQEAMGKQVKVTPLHVSHSPMYFDQCLDWAAQIIGNAPSPYG